MNFLDFDALADGRGDGLHPQLRALLEARARLQADARVVELAGSGLPVQAGPNPSPRRAAVVNDNVLRLKPRQRVARHS